MVLVNRSRQPHYTTVTSQNRRKILIFVAFVISAIVLIRFTPIKNYLTIEPQTAFLESAGLWVPVVYIII